MVKHTETIRQQQPTNCLSVFDHFVKDTGLFIPLKTSDNLWLSDIFVGYRKRPVAWNVLKAFSHYSQVKSFQKLKCNFHDFI